MRTRSIISASALFILAGADPLDKPPLADNLDYLQKGLLQSLPSTDGQYTQWIPDWIPADCKTLTEDANLSATDVEVFNVQYDDCPNDPWILCRHKDSPDPIQNMIDLFGRVPVHARQWVRHIINLPDPKNTNAYNSGGNIAMFDRNNGDLTVFIHETAHSLDLLGAYTGTNDFFFDSDTWLNNYAKDSHVPDFYSQTNQLENLAQNTVVAAYDLNVPGGFSEVQPKWQGLRHQLSTIVTEQKEKGDLLIRAGLCTKRLANSKVVLKKAHSRNKVRQLEEPPNVGLSDSVDIIEPVDFDTKEACKRG